MLVDPTNRKRYSGSRRNPWLFQKAVGKNNTSGNTSQDIYWIKWQREKITRLKFARKILDNNKMRKILVWFFFRTLWNGIGFTETPGYIMPRTGFVTQKSGASCEDESKNASRPKKENGCKISKRFSPFSLWREEKWILNSKKTLSTNDQQDLLMDSTCEWDVRNSTLHKGQKRRGKCSIKWKSWVKEFVVPYVKKMRGPQQKTSKYIKNHRNCKENKDYISIIEENLK